MGLPDSKLERFSCRKSQIASLNGTTAVIRTPSLAVAKSNQHSSSFVQYISHRYSNPIKKHSDEQLSMTCHCNVSGLSLIQLTL